MRLIFCELLLRDPDTGGVTKYELPEWCARYAFNGIAMANMAAELKREYGDRFVSFEWFEGLEGMP